MMRSTASRWRTSSRRTDGRNSISPNAWVRMRACRPVNRLSSTDICANSSPCWNVRASPSRAITCGSRPAMSSPRKRIAPSPREMPLTQLSTLVLPAPLGPMSANSSPCSTARDTPSSTVRPPKRRVRCSTASSAIPSPAAAVLLDVAVAPAFAAGAAEIEFLDIGMAAQALGCAVEHDAAALHHVAVVGDLRGSRRALFEGRDGEAGPTRDLGEPAQKARDYARRKPERQLVDQQQLGSADDGACNRQHLPLAAGKEPADAGPELRE